MGSNDIFVEPLIFNMTLQIASNNVSLYTYYFNKIHVIASSIGASFLQPRNCLLQPPQALLVHWQRLSQLPPRLPLSHAQLLVIHQ